jgi:glyoxylase-like metal-dependent hydrolase (beta-lactamase superfamily II)
MSPLSATAADQVSWNLGDLVVHRVDETVLPPATGPWLLPEATEELIDQSDWLRPHFADRALRLVSHSFAIEVGGLRILVDTGIGNGKTRANPAWNDLDTDYLDRLAAVGFTPESVDLVVTTHLHTDHVGWNTRRDAAGRWVPTFPSARHVTSRSEWEYWASIDLDESRRQMFADSVHPVRDSGQVDLVDVTADGWEIAPCVRLVPAPGHTPGQVAVELTGSERSALVSGDSVHHPIQLAHPRLTSCVDVDPAQAVRSREAILRRLCGTDTLLLGTHFAHPTAGVVRRDGRHYRFEPRG